MPTAPLQHTSFVYRKGAIGVLFCGTYAGPCNAAAACLPAMIVHDDKVPSQQSQIANTAAAFPCIVAAGVD